MGVLMNLVIGFLGDVCCIFLVVPLELMSMRQSEGEGLSTMFREIYCTSGIAGFYQVCWEEIVYFVCLICMVSFMVLRCMTSRIHGRQAPIYVCNLFTAAVMMRRVGLPICSAL